MLIALMLSLGQAWAQTQWDGRLEWASDERSRGLSVSGEHPVWRASLNVDHDGGLYGGATASISTGHQHDRARQSLYAGYAAEVPDSALNWDAGAVAYRIQQESTNRRQGYGEPYAGLHGRDWHMRLAYDIHYEGSTSPATYLEFDQGYPLDHGWRLNAHAGWQHRWPRRESTPPPSLYNYAYGDAYDYSTEEQDKDRLDLRLSIGTRHGDLLIGLSMEAAVSAHVTDTAAVLSLGWGF